MYKTYLYKLATFFSPNFDRHIVKKLQNKNSLKILDIGFYKGSFSKAIINKLFLMDSDRFITLYSFDPNKNTTISEFKNFITDRNVNWIHKTIAIGDVKKEEEFTILSSFPSSGSSINNILQDSLWYKTRKFIFDPFGKKENRTTVVKVEVDTVDNIFQEIQSIDLIKIDVEGYSLNVLKGAKNYLKNNSPILQVEILSKKHDFKNKEAELIEYLQQLNYELINRKKHYTTHLFSDVICLDYLFEK